MIILKEKKMKTKQKSKVRMLTFFICIILLLVGCSNAGQEKIQSDKSTKANSNDSMDINNDAPLEESTYTKITPEKFMIASFQNGYYLSGFTDYTTSSDHQGLMICRYVVHEDVLLTENDDGSSYIVYDVCESESNAVELYNGLTYAYEYTESEPEQYGFNDLSKNSNQGDYEYEVVIRINNVVIDYRGSRSTLQKIVQQMRD